MTYGVTVSLTVEAEGVNDATDKVKSLIDQDFISSVELEDGPDELATDEEEEEEEE